MARLSFIVTSVLAAIATVSAVPSSLSPRKANAYGTKTSRSFVGERVTITTKQSYNITNGLIQDALLYDTYDSCSMYGAALPLAGKGIATQNLTMFLEAVDTRVGPFDFMLFDTVSFEPYLTMYLDPVPQIQTYIIGNPVVAETMFAEDWVAGLHVPVRIVVIENLAPAVGTTIVYDLPSSVIAIGALKDPKQEKKLKTAAQAVDKYLEEMLVNITKIAPY